jgi:zinc transport system substrate-binding protein
MSRLRRLVFALAAGSALTTAPAFAFDGVVASIKPVHSLVSAVMEGVGTPDLIVRSTGSEHAYSLRPSDANALQNAKVIFWIGPEMETFLTNSIQTLGGKATVVALDDTKGLTKLKFRDGGPFEAHSHDAEAREDGDHAHDDHDDHDHEGHDHDAHDEHAHGRDDLHVWLDPLNAKLLLGEIETTLSAADPANAQAYKHNAQAYAARLDSLVAEIDAALAPVRTKPVIVFHDAYQYFEQRFGVNVVGSITVNPEIMPGAQRVADIRARIIELDAACIFSEPQFEPRLVTVVAEGTNAKTGVLDPLGAELTDGPELYLDLIRNMATSFTTCLG